MNSAHYARYYLGQRFWFLTQSGYEFRGNEWVDVKDRLPEKNGLYLVWDNEDNAVHKMSYNNGIWRSNGCVNCTEYISHYMPLPSPPNKG